MNKNRADHRGTGTRRKKSLFFKASWRPLWLHVSVVILGLASSVVSACPLCVDATPYKKGLMWAVWFILPVPFALAGWLYYMIRRSIQAESQAAEDKAS